MEDKEKNDGSSGAWWGGWLQAAKNTTANAYEFVKKDLGEFTNVMKTDTTEVAKTIHGNLTQEKASAAGAKVRDGVTGFLGDLSKALKVEAEDLHSTDQFATHSNKLKTYNREQARLLALQLDPGTYLTPPENTAEFDTWKQSFVLDDKKGDISELLVTNVEVRALYTTVVPSQLSHPLFWQHYFFKVSQLQADEAKRAQLVQRAQNPDADVDLAWDDDLDDDWVKEQGISQPVPAAFDSKEEVPKTVTDNPTAECSRVTSHPQDAASPSPQDTRPDQTDIEEADHPIEDLKLRTKGDMLVVGTSSARTTPSTESTDQPQEGSSTSLDEDWEAEFADAEEPTSSTTPRPAEQKLTEKDDDWENWE